tara:strand:+ start:861 stop:1028 length:168 start_codon:yes stop_codon:yes gene_type:complete
MQDYNHLENIIRDKDESIASLQTLIEVQKKVIISLKGLINDGFKEIEKEENQASF